MSSASGPDTEDTSGVRSFLDVVAGLIHEVDLYMLRYQRALGNTIAKVLDGNGVVKDYINLGVLFSLGVITAYAAVGVDKWAVAVQTAVATIRTAIATVLDRLHVALIIAGHRVLTYFIPQYRELFEGIATAAAGISQTLGMGIEFLPSLLMNANAIMVNAAVIFGADPKQAQFEALPKLAQWLTGLQHSFDTYARNPGAILDSLQTFIVTEAQTQAAEGIGKLTSTINGLETTVTNTVDDFFTLEGSVNTLIEDLPGETFGVIQEWWGPIDESIQQWRTDVFNPAIEYLNGALEPLQQLADDNAAKIALADRERPTAPQSLFAVLGAKIAGLAAPFTETLFAMDGLLTPSDGKTLQDDRDEINALARITSALGSGGFGAALGTFREIIGERNRQPQYVPGSAVNAPKVAEPSDQFAFLLRSINGV